MNRYKIENIGNIFVCCGSRGSYMGFQFAAVEPRVRSVAAICPCIDLLVPREFSGIVRSSILHHLTLITRWFS
jgi:hypothetical protein